MNQIEVCYSPVLFPYSHINSDHIVVIIDVLRATSSICAALDNGIKGIIPVAGTEEAMKYKSMGYLVASERDGNKLAFADFGNSPHNFQKPELKGKVIVYSTTNGTQAIEMARSAELIAIASFPNFSAISAWLIEQKKDVLLFCSGWKNKYNMEDSAFAGALSENLLENGFVTSDDATKASIHLWNSVKHDLMAFADTTSHKLRLSKFGLDDSIRYCFTADSTKVVPVMREKMLVDFYAKQ